MTKSLGVLNQFPLSAALKAEFESLFRLIGEAEAILISSTEPADGDSIGAQIGLALFIEAAFGKSKSFEIVNHSPVPKRYRFLEGAEIFRDIRSASKDSIYDLGVCLDGGVERTGAVAEFFSSISKKALIDHHKVGSRLDYDAKVLDLESSSTCEIVYLLHEYFDLPISQKLAAALYIGIVFDTGFFKHNITKPRTHHVAARLIETGIDFSEISDRAILQRSLSGQRLLQIMMQNLRFEKEGKVALSYWTADDLRNAGFEDGDQEGLINQLYFTEGVEVVILATELHEKELKLSFRSKGQVDVAEFARKLNPEGGGHIRAAGCSLQADLREALQLVSRELNQVL